MPTDTEVMMVNAAAASLNPIVGEGENRAVKTIPTTRTIVGPNQKLLVTSPKGIVAIFSSLL